MSVEAQFFFYLFAFIAFVLAAANVPLRANLVAVGLALWVFVPLFTALKAL